MRAARVSALITVVALAASAPAQFAAPAAALEPGVHIDPGSPAAKEYALPVNQARATGTGSGERSQGSAGQLFGAGIKPPSSGSPGARPGAGRAAAHGASGSPHASPQASPAQAASPAAVEQAAARSASGGGSSALVLFAGGVAILVLGAFTGTVLRHNRRPTSAP